MRLKLIIMVLCSLFLISCANKKVSLPLNDMKSTILNTMILLQDVEMTSEVFYASKSLCKTLYYSNITLLDYSSYRQTNGIEYYSISPRVFLINAYCKFYGTGTKKILKLSTVEHLDLYKVADSKFNNSIINDIIKLYTVNNKIYTKKVKDIIKCSVNLTVYNKNMLYYSIISSMEHRKININLSNDIISSINTINNSDDIAWFPAMWAKHLIKTNQDVALSEYSNLLINYLAKISKKEKNTQFYNNMMMLNCALFNCTSNRQELLKLSNIIKIKITNHNDVVKTLGLFDYLRLSPKIEQLE